MDPISTAVGFDRMVAMNVGFNKTADLTESKWQIMEPVGKQIMRILTHGKVSFFIITKVSSTANK